MGTMRVHALRQNLENQITASNPVLLRDFPLRTYMDLIGRYPKIGNYTYISPEVSRLADNVSRSCSRTVFESYHKCLMLSLIEKALEKLEHVSLPGEIKTYYHMNFERIIDDIESGFHETGFYLYPRDKFLKDLGICSLRLIPAGVQKINLAPLPPEFLFRNGASQFISGLLYVLFELKGFKPLYNMHTDSHDTHLMSEFNPDGWRNFLVRAADLIKLNPSVKGVFGKTWFVDPQLEKISPRLCYVRHIFNRNGGRFFYLGPCTSGIEDAVYKSPTRKKLYEHGKYIPKDYLGVWSGRSLIKWAECQKALMK